MFTLKDNTDYTKYIYDSTSYDESIEILEIIIYAELLNPEISNGSFKLYVNHGNKLPTSELFSFQDENVGYDGKGVAITKESMDKDCWQS